jgi:inorganic pyrophosphatase
VPATLKECRDLKNQYTRELKATINFKRMKNILKDDESNISKSVLPKVQVRRIQNAEEVQRVFRKCALARGKDVNGGI